MAYTQKLYFLVGPSGVGKDSVLRRLKTHFYSDTQPLVAHRYITRPSRQQDENHIELSEFDFQRRSESGLFLFEWNSHGYRYAVGREIKKWLKSGNSVIVNGSREYLAQARQCYKDLIPVWMHVSEDVLRERLLQRGRESTEEIETRLKRNRELATLKPKDGVYIDNNQTVEDTIGQLLSLMELSNI
jgi:ribose 1,5-bisphosphokinase